MFNNNGGKDGPTDLFLDTSEISSALEDNDYRVLYDLELPSSKYTPYESPYPKSGEIPYEQNPCPVALSENIIIAFNPLNPVERQSDLGYRYSVTETYISLPDGDNLPFQNMHTVQTSQGRYAEYGHIFQVTSPLAYCACLVTPDSVVMGAVTTGGRIDLPFGLTLQDARPFFFNYNNSETLVKDELLRGTQYPKSTRKHLRVVSTKNPSKPIRMSTENQDLLLNLLEQEPSVRTGFKFMQVLKIFQYQQLQQSEGRFKLVEVK